VPDKTLSLISKISESPKYENIRNFFIDEKNSMLFVLLIPLLRKLPYRECRGNLDSVDMAKQNDIFSLEKLKAIQKTFNKKFPSNSLITIGNLMKNMY
jgi:hypothetical protein